jgi:hypothetical protein
VACVNPATFSTSAGGLTPLFPKSEAPTRGVNVTTPWVSFPGLYTAQCEQHDGASWLQVSTVTTSGDPRPTLESRDPVWGYHVEDMSLTLGNLVTDVATEEAAYH